MERNAIGNSTQPIKPCKQLTCSIQEPPLRFALAHDMECAVCSRARHSIGKDEGRGKAQGCALTHNAGLHFNPLPLTCACDEIDRKIHGHQLALAMAKRATQTHRVVCQGRQKCTMDQPPAVAVRWGCNNTHVNCVTNPF